MIFVSKQLLSVLQSYEETLDFLYKQLPMFSRIGAAAYKDNLHNTEALCSAFNHPERRVKTVHVAGTNGKGSTSHMLAAIFHQAGYKTGLYTSPHLKDFRERIKISSSNNNGEPGPMEMIPKDFVVEFTARAEPFIEVLQPSFFELTVVMAFEFFASQNVDIAIIETGLGGRLDSTNVIVPELSIITNVSLDHTNLLGKTLPEIAKEKAGIIKQGIPVLIGQKEEETTIVFETTANAAHANILWAEERTLLVDYQQSIHCLQSTWRRLGVADTFTIVLDLPGLYQLKNVANVITATEVLNQKGFKLSDENIIAALEQVKYLTGLHGRWEVLQENPAVILDVGHNEDGVKRIVEQLTQFSETTEKTIHIIIGMVKDKAVAEVLQLFPKSYQFYFTEANIPRALPATELQEMAFSIGITGKVYVDVNEALEVAKSVAKEEDIIVVCGSVFLVGEVKDLMSTPPKKCNTQLQER